MEEKSKLTLKKPLSLEKEFQIFQSLKPVQEQTDKENREKQDWQARREAKKKKREELNKTLAWLYERFPDCFHPKDLKPLKLSIHKDIHPILENESFSSKMNLKNALTFYTNNIHYLDAVIKGTHRYDLEGNQVQEITEEQKAYAQEKLEKVLQAIKAKKDTKNKKFKEEKRDNSIRS